MGQLHLEIIIRLIYSKRYFIFEDHAPLWILKKNYFVGPRLAGFPWDTRLSGRPLLSAPSPP